MRVPFFIRSPGLAPRRVATPIRLVDLAPTLLEWIDLEPLPNAEGRSLVAELRLGGVPNASAITEHVKRFRVTGSPFSLLVEAEGVQLFNLDRDPAETQDLSAAHPAVAEQLLAELDLHHARPRIAIPRHDAPAAPIDRRTREILEELGYVE